MYQIKSFKENYPDKLRSEAESETCSRTAVVGTLSTCEG